MDLSSRMVRFVVFQVDNCLNTDDAFMQTSSGKTFTMNGSAKHPGVIPQTIYDCFEAIHDMPDREFLFRVSYLEIYNETVPYTVTCFCK